MPNYLLVPGGVISVGSREPAATVIEGLSLPFVLDDDEDGSPSPHSQPAPSFTGLSRAAGPSAMRALRRMLAEIDDAARAVDDARRRMSLLRDSGPEIEALLEVIDGGEVASAVDATWDAHAGSELPFALGMRELPAPPEPAVLQTSTAAGLRVRLLGRFEVEAGGRVLPAWRSHRARRLFAYLALNRRDDISRHRLMGLFWPDHSEDRAENNLSLAIMALRRLVDEGGSGISLIGFRAGCYFLTSGDITVDTEEFVEAVHEASQLDADGRDEDAARALDRAIGLYAGDLLPGELYEEWTNAPRRQLQDAFVEALQRRARLARAAGDYETSLALSRRLLDSDPVNEEAHRQVMQDYVRLGNRSRALAQMEACREALQKNLGLEPEAETVALFARIRAGQAF